MSLRHAVRFEAFSALSARQRAFLAIMLVERDALGLRQAGEPASAVFDRLCGEHPRRSDRTRNRYRTPVVAVTADEIKHFQFTQRPL